MSQILLYVLSTLNRLFNLEMSPAELVDLVVFLALTVLSMKLNRFMNKKQSMKTSLLG